jgi:hypothetical protein
MSDNPNCNHIGTEHSCRICGFMDPDFRDTDDLYSSYCPREFGGTGELGFRSYTDRVYPLSDRGVAERYTDDDSFSWYQGMGPHWLQKELKRLFPEDTGPFPPSVFNDLGMYVCIFRGCDLYSLLFYVRHWHCHLQDLLCFVFLFILLSILHF